jgi:chemotaxis response regulator CheB
MSCHGFNRGSSSFTLLRLCRRRPQSNEADFDRSKTPGDSIANQAFVLNTRRGLGRMRISAAAVRQEPCLRRSVGPATDHHLPRPRALVAMSLAIPPTPSKRSTRPPEPAARNRQWPKPPASPLTLVGVTASDKQPNLVVGIGASAGGLAAFKNFLVHTPADTGMVFVPVQHLAPSHPIALTEELARATKMPGMEVRDESTVAPNGGYANE